MTKIQIRKEHLGNAAATVKAAQKALDEAEASLDGDAGFSANIAANPQIGVALADLREAMAEHVRIRAEVKEAATSSADLAWKRGER